MPWRRTWHPTPVSLPGEPQEQRSLAGCSPWGCRESGTTKHTPVSGRHLPKCDLTAGVASISPQSPQGPLPPPLPCSHASEFQPFRLNCGVIPEGGGPLSYSPAPLKCMDLLQVTKDQDGSFHLSSRIFVTVLTFVPLLCFFQFS